MNKFKNKSYLIITNYGGDLMDLPYIFLFLTIFVAILVYTDF